MAQRTAIDLTRYHGQQQHGDITAYLTWWLADDSGPKPCLVLVPTYQQSVERCTPCVVLLDQAWIWSEEIGDPAHAARLAFTFAQMLGLDITSPTQPFRVRSIIVGHLGDLLTIPPMPADMRETINFGEAVVTDRESGRTIEREIIHRV